MAAMMDSETKAITPKDTYIQQLEARIAALEQNRPATSGTILVTDIDYRAMFDANQSINLIIDGDTLAIIDVNPAAARYYGYPRDVMQTMTLADLGVVPLEEIRERLWQSLAQINVAAYAQPATIVCMHRLADDTLRQIEASPSPLQGNTTQLVLLSINDITERKAIEDRLRHSEDILQEAARLAKVGSWEIDLNKMMVLWSAQTKRIHEVPDDYVPDLETAINFYAPEARDIITELVRLAIADGIPWDVELPFITATGRRLWVRAIGKPIVEDHKTVKLFGVFQDITSQRLAQEALSQSEARYRDVVEVQTELVCRYLPDTTITFVNDAYCRFFDTTAEGLINHTILSMVGLDRAQEFREHLRELMYATTALNYEHQTINAAGKKRWLEWTDQAIFDDDGNIVEIQAVGRDITERKRMEDELRQSEARYRLLARNFPSTAVLLFDEDMRYLLAEGPVLQQLGYRKDQMEGRVMHEIASPGYAELLEPRYQRVLDGEEFSYEYEWKGNIYNAHYLPITYADKSAGMVVLTDITQRKQLQEQAVSLAVATERVQFLAEFITIASHEFRTPLAVINSSTYLLRRVEDPEKRVVQLSRIEDQVRSITLLVEKLLEMMRVHTDVQLKRTPSHINSLLGQVLDSMSQHIIAQDLQVVLEMDPELPRLLLDQGQIVKALQHLMDNAVRFSEVGRRLFVHTDTITHADRPYVRVRIVDEGIGMDAETQKRLFDGFYRYDLSHATPGFGLGASITRKIIDLHDGEISVDSTLGAGTTITLLLPIVPL